MPTPAADRSAGNEKPGIGPAVKEVAEHASSLARLELELAGVELKTKARALGVGIGLGAAAALMGLYGLGFLLATIAVVLAIVLDTWLALLLVTVALFALAFALGMVALGRIKRGSPPVPEQAIAEAKLTTEALKSNGNG